MKELILRKKIAIIMFGESKPAPSQGAEKRRPTKLFELKGKRNRARLLQGKRQKPTNVSTRRGHPGIVSPGKQKKAPCQNKKGTDPASRRSGGLSTTGKGQTLGFKSFGRGKKNAPTNLPQEKKREGPTAGGKGGNWFRGIEGKKNFFQRQGEDTPFYEGGENA